MMNKIYQHLAILAVALAAAVPAFAQGEATAKHQMKLSDSYETHIIDTITYIIDVDAHTATVSDASSRHGAVDIPEIVKVEYYTDGNYKVTAIADGAFSCGNITKVTLPATITTIEQRSFWDCTSLKSINIPNAVTVINKRVFKGCSSLVSVSISDAVTSIGEEAFSGCSSLKSISIPDAVTSIGDEVFSGCSSLKQVNMGTKLKDVGQKSFINCTSLENFSVASGNPYFSSIDGLLLSKTGKTLIQFPNGKGDDYVIPAVVDTIGYEAFYSCTFSHFTIPGTVSTIGASAFEKCNASSITIGNGVKSIEDYAFFDSPSLTSVTIGNAVTNMGNNIFYACTGLSTAYITEGVTMIGMSMFSYCSALNSIHIPSSVNEIGGAAFYNCTSLKNVYYNRKQPLEIEAFVFAKTPLSGVTLYVPTGCKSSYEQTSVWEDFGTITEMDFNMKGDLNQDGMVNVTDVTSLAGYILGTSSLYDNTKADLNGDGKTDVTDLAALIKMILG